MKIFLAALTVLIIIWIAQIVIVAAVSFWHWREWSHKYAPGPIIHPIHGGGKGPYGPGPVINPAHQ